MEGRKKGKEDTGRGSLGKICKGYIGMQRVSLGVGHARSMEVTCLPAFGDNALFS